MQYYNINVSGHDSAHMKRREHMGKIDYIHTVQPGTGGIDDAFLNQVLEMGDINLIIFRVAVIMMDNEAMQRKRKN